MYIEVVYRVFYICRNMYDDETFLDFFVLLLYIFISLDRGRIDHQQRDACI